MDDDNFKQISTIGAWLMITNQLTSEVQLVGRDRGLANIVAKK